MMKRYTPTYLKNIKDAQGSKEPGGFVEKVSLNMNWEDLWVSMQYPYLWATSA